MTEARRVGPTGNMISLQPPVPGEIQFLLAQVARAKGVVNPKGPYRGQVSLTGLMRGTSLASTTIHPLLHNPEAMKMLHLDTLARLCDFLRVQPGELLVYKPGVTAGGRPLISERYKQNG